MAPEQAAPGGKLDHAGLATGAEKLGRGRRTRAPSYLALSDEAAAAGYVGISARMIETWVGDGLLPSPVVRTSIGNAGFRTTLRPGVLEQLLALCELRRERKSHDWLAIRLWMAEWTIAPERVRAATLRRLPVVPDLKATRQADLDVLALAARDRGPAIGRRLGRGRVSRGSAETATFILGQVALGADLELDDAAIIDLELATGIRQWHGAAHGTEPGRPPAEAYAAPLEDLPRVLSLARVRELVSTATDDEVTSVQHVARSLAVDVPEIVRAAGNANRGPRVVGMLARLYRERPEYAIAFAVFAARSGLRARLVAFTDSLVAGRRRRRVASRAAHKRKRLHGRGARRDRLGGSDA